MQVLSLIATGPRIVLRRTTHYGSLVPDDYYVITVLYTIPPTLPAGQYNITVETDYRNHVFEFDRENNNIRWKLITIMEEHPDLTIMSSVDLITSVEGNKLVINYTITNNGAGPTFRSTWRDVVVITNVQNQAAVQLKSDIHRGLLLPGENYTDMFETNLQHMIIGNYVLRIQTDIDERIKEENENNNIYITHLTVPAIYSDLFAYNVMLDQQGIVVAGNTLEVSWFVRNIGNGLAQGYWNDSVYIDSPPSLSPRGIRITSVSASHLLMPGEGYQQTLNVTVPVTLSGDFFIFVHVNEQILLFENGNTHNNIISYSITVVSPPSPDLMVSSITYSQTQTESDDRILMVSWIVTNIGNSMEQLGSWRDEVFLSKTTAFNENESISIGYSSISNLVLASMQEYKTSLTAILNTNVSGFHYVFVVTDSSREQLEINGEMNNIKRSSESVEIIPPPFPRLRIAINSGNYPGSLTSGSSISVNYTVTNIGERYLDLSSWTDQIYLSPHSGIDRQMIIQEGLLLKEVVNNQGLNVGESYFVSSEVVLPYGLNQYVYIVVVVDVNGNLGDPFVVGDMQVLHGVSTYSFLVENGPLPDLIISPLLSSAPYRSGEPATLHFQVANRGQNMASGPWYDTVYLSRNPALDELDIRLVTARNNKSLEIQAAYNQTVNVFLPYNLPSSEYYFIFVTDVGDSQLEISDSNNIAEVVINIEATVSTDILLDEVSVTPSDLQYRQSKIATCMI